MFEMIVVVCIEDFDLLVVCVCFVLNGFGNFIVEVRLFVI